MLTVLIDLTFGAILATAGAIAGWWLRGAARSSSADGEEGRRAREVLGRLQDVAVRIAANVGEHSSRVEEINQELNANEGQQAEAVVSAVAKLIAANQQMQQQLSSAEEKLEEQARLAETHAVEARTDVLTGLANRRALDDELARRHAEFRRTGQPLSLVLADVDQFKHFNDTHGHQAGDEVLRRVAAVLQRSAREMDLVARYGGEEFAVVLPGTMVQEAAEFADRVRRAIEATSFRFADVDLSVTASFGAAQLYAGDDGVALVRRADAAMYGSKEAGRNCSHWHDGLNLHAVPQQKKPIASASDGAREVPQQEANRPASAAAPPAAEAEPKPGGASTSSSRLRNLTTRSDFCMTLGRRLAEWRRGGACPAVLLVRIDDYAGVVARHGPQGGTLTLRATAQFLLAAVREMDVAAEYDESSFAMLLPGATLGSLVHIAERLRQAIARCSLPAPSGSLQFTVSVGGTIAAKNDETHTLLWRAEEAVDAAVKAGGNSSFYHTGQWSETATAALEHAHAVSK